MEVEPHPDQPPTPVTEEERERAVEVLQRAAGDGRLPLEEFSDRVGAALAAETRQQLESATADLQPAPPVGSANTVSTVVSVLGDRHQTGRWRLPRSPRALASLGDIHLDLRGVVVSDDVVEISALTLLGDFSVDVPEGVEVELNGFDLLGDRELRLAHVPRREGTPLVRIRAYGLLGDVSVRTPAESETPAELVAGTLARCEVAPPTVAACNPSGRAIRQQADPVVCGDQRSPNPVGRPRRMLTPGRTARGR